MSFNASCAPGPDAAAGAQRISEDVYALVMFLDPANVALQSPPFPDGNQVFAKFLRELSREATKLANMIDGQGRHVLATPDSDTW